MRPSEKKETGGEQQEVEQKETGRRWMRARGRSQGGGKGACAGERREERSGSRGGGKGERRKETERGRGREGRDRQAGSKRWEAQRGDERRVKNPETAEHKRPRTDPEENRASKGWDRCMYGCRRGGGW